MAKTLSQLLGYMPLTGLIKAVSTGIPNVLPPAFWSNPKKTLGNVGRYTVVRGTRATAKQTTYGSQARQRELRDLDIKDVKLLHTYEFIKMDLLLLQMLRNYDNYDVQNMGMQEVDRQQAEFRAYFDNLRLAAVYSMLSLGHVYFDREGNLLPSSSTNVLDIDYQIDANHMNQLNGIIASTWATSSNDIPLQLRNLRIQAAKDTGYPLKYAFYGVNIPSYLTKNDYVKDYLSRNPAFAQKYLEQAEIPDGLFGFTWVPVYTSFFEDQNGTNQSFFGADAVVFTPEINPLVYELMEGTFQVPTTFNATNDLAGAIDTCRAVQGMFSYGIPCHNPPTVEMFYGDTFLPIWKVPGAIYIADVTP